MLRLDSPNMTYYCCSVVILPILGHTKHRNGSDSWNGHLNIESALIFLPLLLPSLFSSLHLLISSFPLISYLPSHPLFQFLHSLFSSFLCSFSLSFVSSLSYFSSLELSYLFPYFPTLKLLFLSFLLFLFAVFPLPVLVCLLSIFGLLFLSSFSFLTFSRPSPLFFSSMSSPFFSYLLFLPTPLSSPSLLFYLLLSDM